MDITRLRGRAGTPVPFQVYLVSRHEVRFYQTRSERSPLKQVEAKWAESSANEIAWVGGKADSHTRVFPLGLASCPLGRSAGLDERDCIPDDVVLAMRTTRLPAAQGDCFVDQWVFCEHWAKDLAHQMRKIADLLLAATPSEKAPWKSYVLHPKAP